MTIVERLHSTRGFASVADYRDAARRRLPRIAFDYLDGGAEDGRTLARNTAAYANVFFASRVMCDVSSVSTATQLGAFTSAAPMVVGPTGLNGLFWPKGDELLAAAAARAGVPFALSSASTSLLEDVRAAAPKGELWMQLYIQKDRRIAESMMRRASEAGYTTLLVTVDTPVHGKRDHDIHNGYRLPLPITLKLVLDLLRHPHWAMQIARYGSPQLTNLARSLGESPNLERQATALARQMDLTLTWHDLAWLRTHWQGPLLVKGIQTVADARLAHQHGADGIVLSNHGGRQLESALAPLEMLPSVVAAVGKSLDVYVDGGIRRGADVLKAVALGARAVLLGRAPLYGLAARGSAGATHVLSLLHDEMITTLTLLGCTGLDTVGERIAEVPPVSRAPITAARKLACL
ncbi:alpha-hydroxy acid oxidase [Paraburkholderia sediminicola]|uniref:alpha-hydroxy acid oxidase n=1 Tax=Paraburkholderia sediminicola TaxID=458836 RepID=UPI0038BCB89A